MPHVTGIHHITAIASTPQPNVDFYEGTLGQRTIKQTVNFDDSSSYHLYYGDYPGHPGTLLTFFTWPHLPQSVRGSGEVSATVYGLTPAQFNFWQTRLKDQGVAFEEINSPFGERLLAFTDPDGLPICIAEHEGITIEAWPLAPVQADQYLQGFFTAQLHVHNLGEMDLLLTAGIGLTKEKHAEHAIRYSFPEQQQFIDVIERPDAQPAQMGLGSVHHIAYRVPDQATQVEMRQQLLRVGIPSTQVIDRQYFTSIYFQTPAGILFEIATDGPGFAVDEPAEKLGESLQLPPQYQAQRKEIEAALTPISLPRQR